MTDPRDTLVALASELGLDTHRLLQTHACALALDGDVHLELQWREAEDALWVAARIGYPVATQRHALAVSALLSSTALAQATGASLAQAPDSQAVYLCRSLLLREQSPASVVDALRALALDCQAARRHWVDAQLLAG